MISTLLKVAALQMAAVSLSGCSDGPSVIEPLRVPGPAFDICPTCVDVGEDEDNLDTLMHAINSMPEHGARGDVREALEEMLEYSRIFADTSTPPAGVSGWYNESTEAMAVYSDVWNDPQEAYLTILHEGFHHTGIQNEALAENVAGVCNSTYIS
ncbi:hypothetical protein [Gaopeijia maritima]|uniref:Lipoprotein n=1 Tax=Gaopeijia maritima TaxID=3119007 RepID=A0ABU9E4A6_9BACT